MKIDKKTIEAVIWLLGELLTLFRQIKKDKRNEQREEKESER